MKHYVVSIIMAVELDAPDESAIMKMGTEIGTKLQEALNKGEWEIVENGIEEQDADGNAI